MFDKKLHLDAEMDDIRKLILFEPRGAVWHNANIILPSNHPGAQMGYVILETDFDARPGNETPQTGQFLLVVNPARAGNSSFAARMADFVAFLREAGVDRLPSDRRYRHRDAAAERGIPVTDGIRAPFA